MYDQDQQIFPLHWNGIDIEISYDPSWSPAYSEIYGTHLAHLECHVVSPKKARLPITETGYKSHFGVLGTFRPNVTLIATSYVL